MLKKISRMFTGFFSNQVKNQSHATVCSVGTDCPKCNIAFDKYYTTDSEEMITCSVCGLKRPIK